MTTPQLTERPRNVGPIRAAAILYGDWGTSKAYVLGIAFALAGYASFPILLAMAFLTGLVGLNYYWICCQYPDGGGVYSAVRTRSRLIAVIGALLLIADYLVTAALSVLEGVNYLAHFLETQFHLAVPGPNYWAILIILAVGLLNWWGPRHGGTLAVMLALPASLAAMSIAAIAIPHLGSAHFQPSTLGWGHTWVLFCGTILALSGVEAISNMTAVMKPDPTLGPGGHLTVKRTARWAILIVALEVVILTIVLAWAMHATPGLDPKRPDAMLGQLAAHFGKQSFGNTVGILYSNVVGVILAVLLFSAGNTAIMGMISVFYMMAGDREMPSPLKRLNRHGVPILPLLIAAVTPCLLLIGFQKVEALAALYAIGVVGAISINVTGCATNRKLNLSRLARTVMSLTAVVMVVIWITIAFEKHEALVFAVTIIALGLMARSFVQERRQTRAEAELREMLGADLGPPPSEANKTRVLVSLRGATATLRFAIEEAKMRQGRLGVLYVREVNVLIPVEGELEDDLDAMRIMRAAQEAASEVPFTFIYRQSNDVPKTILQVTKDFEADFLVIGASAEGALPRLLRGRIATEIGNRLPRQTQLIIHSWRPRK